MFSLVADLEDNIEAIGLVDRFLEHSRFFIFCNGDEPRYYISSGDWLPRNFDRRIEVACPIYDPSLQKELDLYFDLQWQDNVKARIWNGALDNRYRSGGQTEVRAQQALAAYFLQRQRQEPQLPEAAHAE
jgi:polyphosphate kinase